MISDSFSPQFGVQEIPRARELGRSLIVLRKTHNDGLRFATYDYDEYPSKNRLFWGEFGVYVTYEGSAYLGELQAKLYAAMQAANSTKTTKIGFPS